MGLIIKDRKITVTVEPNHIYFDLPKGFYLPKDFDNKGI